MEPRQEGLSRGAEQAPLRHVEYGATNPLEQSKYSPEASVQGGPEVSEAQAEVAQIAMPALPTPVVPSTNAAQGAATDDVPIVANDDDLIEKEWVDKAKKIIAETKDDPYRREREVSKLQIEYIRRRYGREIGDSGD